MKTIDLKRLIADEGKILINTETGVMGYVVNTTDENIGLWEEIDEPKEE